MPEQVFTKEEQKEIIRILKGVIIYTQKKSIMTITEEQLLFEIQDSCNKVSEIIDEKKE